ncbi:hypothetical protein [Caldilinea sp.]|uniref:hypothetical protein n=1 Tax=Caldilinea sp. TaxID=2293560 RepID=UPI002C2C522E|nr:hypothetical protein [Anaerolineales bacterium]HQY94667.1 hypothetical protein [Caldilinea sp.]HRA64695.1 hypothetical protein [Caldilinea sp.]
MLAEMRLDALDYCRKILTTQKHIAGQPHQSSLIDQKLDQLTITAHHLAAILNLTNCWVD